MHTSLTFSEMADKTRCWREDNDCSVKSIAIALDICYAEAWYACRKAGRQYRKGMNLEQIFKAIKSLNRDIVPLDFQGDIVKFMQYYPTGSFIFEIHNHIMSYKNGVLHDNAIHWKGPTYSIYHILEPMEDG